MTILTPFQDEKALVSLYTQTVAALEEALRLGPEDLSKQVEVAQRAVVRLRDDLIKRVRQDDASTEASRWRAALDRVNAALSLIVGVVYPAAGIQRQLLKEALEALTALVPPG